MWRSKWFVKYGVAVLSIAIATEIRWRFHEQLQERVPLTLYFLSVMITAWIGGLGPALLAVALGILAAAHYFIPPDDSLFIDAPADRWAIVVFLFVAIFSALLSHWLRHARQQAEQSAAETRRLNNELRQASQHKDEFLAVLAHELRSPMASIHNAVQVLRREKHNAEAVNEMQQILQRQTQAIMRLVDDLLDVSRINRGTLELQREVVDLNLVLENSVEMAQPQIDSAGHHLEFDLPSEPIWVDADPLRLTQVFVNLLNNACKFTDRCGKIALTVEPHAREVAIRLSDTGVGIAPEILPHIFERFMQAEPDSQRSRCGLGIGLSLVQSLVEEHGGTIEAKSPGLGQGSEFVVRLPLVEALPEESPGDREPPCAYTLRILIVDDAVDAAISLGLILQLDGHEVTVCHDGVSGLAAFNVEKPDIVLLDLKMPGMDGFEVAQRIRKDLNSQETKVIALTGWGDEEDRRRTQDAGFDDHLVKPIDFNKLGRLLHDLATDRTASNSCRRGRQDEDASIRVGDSAPNERRK